MENTVLSYPLSLLNQGQIHRLTETLRNDAAERVCDLLASADETRWHGDDGTAARWLHLAQRAAQGSGDSYLLHFVRQHCTDSLPGLADGETGLL